VGTDQTSFITIDDREVIAMLKRIQSRVSDLKPVMTRIGALYERRVLENFAAEKSPDGIPWKPLAQDTMLIGLARHKGLKKSGGLSARGRRYLRTKKILRERGDLEGSIHFQADGTSVAIGSSGSIPYAAIHQRGGMAGRGRKVAIPARPYLAVNRGKEMVLAEPDRRWIMELIEAELAAAEQKA